MALRLCGRRLASACSALVQSPLVSEACGVPRWSAALQGVASPLLPPGAGFAAAMATRAGRDPRDIAAAVRRKRRGESLQELPHDAVAAVGSESALASALSGSALVITRPVQWGEVILGFEQANQYHVLDAATGRVTALLAEEVLGVADTLQRQLLRSRRSFTATVLAPDGRVLFRVRRPMHVINSSMTIEDAEGAPVGEVRQRWHLLRRKYDLYVGSAQFAAVDEPMLSWAFTLRGESGEPLALVDRNFSGFGIEMFTDAGRYCVHFGRALSGGGLSDDGGGVGGGGSAAPEPRRWLPRVPEPPQQQYAGGGSALQPAPDASVASALAGARALRLSERAVALAAAIAIDLDYFSRDGGGGGGFIPLPFIWPIGGGDGGGGEVGDGGGGAGAAAAGGAAAEAAERQSSEGSGWGSWGGGEREAPQGEDDADAVEEDGGGDDDDVSGGVGSSIWGAVFGSDDGDDDE